MEKALSDLRVLEVAHAWAGPLTGMYLADMGAEVIKIEKPGVGDLQRSPLAHGPSAEGENVVFLFTNRNKKGITLDLMKSKGQEIFKEMVKKADIVIENFVPGTMDRWGINYEVLSKINPRLIMVSVSGFGQTGPYREHGAFDLVIQALSGLMSVTGYPDQPPVRAGSAIADHLGGLFGFCGALIALYWRNKSGQGQWVDSSLMDSTVLTLGDRFVRYAYFGHSELISRVGNRYPWLGRAGFYATKDGYLTFRAASESGPAILARILGREDLITGQEGTDFMASYALLEGELGDELEKFLKDKTNSAALKILNEAGIACAPVLSIDEVINDPQFKEREMFVDVDHPKLGKMKMMGVVPKLSKTPGSIKSAGPLLGQHNEEVYSDLMGYSKEKITQLREEKII